MKTINKNNSIKFAFFCCLSVFSADNGFAMNNSISKDQNSNNEKKVEKTDKKDQKQTQLKIEPNFLFLTEIESFKF